MPKRQYEGMDIPEIAKKLATDCVVTRVLARYLENVLRAVYEDHVKPLHEAMIAVHEIAQESSVPEWQRLQNIAATAKSALNIQERSE